MEGAHVWGYQHSKWKKDSRYELFRRRKNKIAKDLHDLPSHGLKVEDPNLPFHTMQKNYGCYAILFMAQPCTQEKPSGEERKPPQITERA
jgi:hypothetical protein